MLSKLLQLSEAHLNYCLRGVTGIPKRSKTAGHAAIMPYSGSLICVDHQGHDQNPEHDREPTLRMPLQEVVIMTGRIRNTCSPVQDKRGKIKRCKRRLACLKPNPTIRELFCSAQVGPICLQQPRDSTGEEMQLAAQMVLIPGVSAPYQDLSHVSRLLPACMSIFIWKEPRRTLTFWQAVVKEQRIPNDFWASRVSC